MNSEKTNDLEMTLEEFMKIPHRDDKDELSKIGWQLMQNGETEKATKILEYVNKGTCRVGKVTNNAGTLLTYKEVEGSGNDIPTIRVTLKKVNIKETKNE